MKIEHSKTFNTLIVTMIISVLISALLSRTDIISSLDFVFIATCVTCFHVGAFIGIGGVMAENN